MNFCFRPRLLGTRAFWVRVHRYAGLSIALFLIVAGLTGAILPFAAPLHRWLNPPIQVASGAGQPLDPFTLRERALALQPAGVLNVVGFQRQPNDAFEAEFTPRAASAQEPAAELSFSRLVLNPYTGEELRREPGGDPGLWPITHHNLVLVLILLHYSLAIPGSAGVWLFGLAACVWTLDCFVGFGLTLPRAAGNARAGGGEARRSSWLSRWRSSWTMTWRGTPFRVHLQLHRALGLWVWPMLLVFAWSGVAFNLSTQVYQPVMKVCFGLKPSLFASLTDLPTPRTDPGLEWRQAYAVAQRLTAEQASRLGFRVLEDSMLTYEPDKGLFFYFFHSDRDLIQEGGSSAVIFDGNTGALVGVELPTGENAARTFTSWIATLHVAGIGGLPYRLLVAFVGIAVATLSVTGVWVWWKKRSLRRFRV